jgi:hypothetical protein
MEWSLKCSIAEGLLQMSISETVNYKLIVNNPYLSKPVFFWGFWSFRDFLLIDPYKTEILLEEMQIAAAR